MKRRRISLVVDNVRSLWNIGSFFRSADAFAIEHIYLCGYTASPPRKEISKTAIGADQWIPWSREASALELVRNLKQRGYTVIALELAEDGVPLSEHRELESDAIAVVLGNEILGVPEPVRQECDVVTYIPMLGRKNSLNVSVAAGIAMHHYRSI